MVALSEASAPVSGERLRRFFPLVAALFLIHNLEEWLLFDGFVARNDLSAYLPVTRAQFGLSLVFASVLPLVVVAACAGGRKGGWRIWFVFLTQAAAFMNVFTHVGPSLLLRDWAPGVFTGVAVQLPFSVWFARQAFREGWLGSVRSVVVLCVAGLAAQGAAIVALHTLSRALL